jgi:hypothetical protein
VTVESFPVKDLPIRHEMWSKLFDGPRGVMDGTSAGLPLSLSSVSNIATVTECRIALKGFVLEVTGTAELTIPPAVGTPKTYQIGVMYNPADEAAPAGPLSLQAILKTSVSTPVGGAWLPLKEVTRQPSQVLSSAAVSDLQQWVSNPIWRSATTLPPASGAPYGQMIVQNVAGAGVDVMVRTGNPGAETWSSMLRPKWVNLPLAGGIKAYTGYAPRYTLSGGRVHMEGIVERTSGADFADGQLYLVGTLPAILAPDRAVLDFGSRIMQAGSIDARVHIDILGRLTVESPVNCQNIRIDNMSWFPKG